MAEETQETTETESQETSQEITMDQILAEPSVTPDPPAETTTTTEKSKVDVSGLVEKLNKVDQIIDRFNEDALTKDISSAVSKVKEMSGIENDKYCKFMLNEMYDSDESFRKIFDSRGKNPKALDQALDLVAKETVKEFGKKIDSDLKDTQSALLDANNRYATGGGEEPDPDRQQEKELMDLDEAGFAKKMAQLMQN